MPRLRFSLLTLMWGVIAASLLFNGWLLFPKYMAYRERATIEPRIKEFRLAARRKDIDELFGPHALWSSTTDASGHHIRVLLRPKRYQWYCVVERWELRSVDADGRYEPDSMKVYRLKPPPCDYHGQTAWGRETMETYSRAYGESERHPIYRDPYVLDFLVEVTGSGEEHLGIDYELIHQDVPKELVAPSQKDGATPPSR
jgi:hypothetical protein